MHPSVTVATHQRSSKNPEYCTLLVDNHINGEAHLGLLAPLVALGSGIIPIPFADVSEYNGKYI
jgi:hypothetical protein